MAAPDLAVRERGEIERSDREARHTPPELLADSSMLARYARTRIDSQYPLEYLHALLGAIDGKTILDLGCGSGNNTLLLASRGAAVVAVDISLSLVALARERLRHADLANRARFVVGSAHRLPFENASVDAIVGIGVLHHLQLDAASQEIHRVLKPGGRAFFKEPIRNSWLLRTIRACIPYRRPDVSPFERPLTRRQLHSFCRPFERKRARAFSLPFVNVTSFVPALKRWNDAAYACDSALLRTISVVDAICRHRRV